MASIDWDEYKIFKQHSVEEDRLKIVVDFLRSFYSMKNPGDIYNTLVNDDICQMLLERKEITDVEGLENFLLR